MRARINGTVGEAMDNGDERCLSSGHDVAERFVLPCPGARSVDTSGVGVLGGNVLRSPTIPHLAVLRRAHPRGLRPGRTSEVRKRMKDRLDYLDGLRGAAAVVVVVFHGMSALTPWLVPDQQNNAALISYSPIAVFWNGPFAVSVFFVLSGFVVTNATLRRSDPLWVDIVIRYLRLAVPATLSALLAWALLSALPNAAAGLHALNESPWLKLTYQGEIPGPIPAAYNGFIGIFLTGNSNFNNVLWTMRPELIGSIACFVICLFKNFRARLFATVIFAVIVLLSRRFEYECFVLGICLREAWAAGRLPSAFPTAALLLGLLIGSQSGDAATLLGLGWLPKSISPGEKSGLLYPLGAGLVVYGCMRSAAMRRLLEGDMGRFIGMISFPLYLIHVPIFYTIMAKTYILSHSTTSFIIFGLVSYALMMVALAYCAERYLERPFLRQLGKLRRKLGSLMSSPARNSALDRST